MKRIFTPRKSKKILIVSDDLASASLYREKLEGAQFCVEIASDGRLALRIIEIDPVDLVIVDLSKTGIHGVETIRSCRSQPDAKATPVIALSNHYFGRLFEAATEAGAVGCVTKTDCTPRHLVTIVRAAFAGNLSGPISPGPLVAAEDAEVTATNPHHGELEFEAKVAGTFFNEAPRTIALLRSGHRSLTQGASEASRLAELPEMHRQAGMLASAAGLAGFRKIAQLASALDALLIQLQEEPAKIEPATTRMMAQAVDLLAALLEKVAAPASETSSAPAILVVGNKTSSTEALCSALCSCGLEPVPIGEVQVAADRLVQNRFDLILVDDETLGQASLEFCASIRKQPMNRFTPLLFVTAHADLASRARASLSGVSDLIAKPFLPAELAMKALILLFKGKPIAAHFAARMSLPQKPARLAPEMEPLGYGILHWGSDDDSLRHVSAG